VKTRNLTSQKVHGLWATGDRQRVLVWIAWDAKSSGGYMRCYGPCNIWDNEQESDEGALGGPQMAKEQSSVTARRFFRWLRQRWKHSKRINPGTKQRKKNRSPAVVPPTSNQGFRTIPMVPGPRVIPCSNPAKETTSRFLGQSKINDEQSRVEQPQQQNL